MLEHVVGLKPDATTNTLTWNIRGEAEIGCDRYRFNGHEFSLKAKPVRGDVELTIEADSGFTLRVRRGGASRDFVINAGSQRHLIHFART